MDTEVAEEECDEILEVIRAEAASLPSTVQIPSILTSMDIRPFLREMIVAEFPRIRAVQAQALPRAALLPVNALVKPVAHELGPERRIDEQPLLRHRQSRRGNNGLKKIGCGE